MKWPERLRSALPRQPLTRLRLLLLVLSLGGAVQVLARIAAAQDAGGAMRAAGGLALALLCGWWLHGYRRRALPAIGLPLEGLAIVLLGAPMGGPLNLLGFLVITLMFRSLYGSSAMGALPTLTWSLALAAGYLLAPFYAGPSDGSFHLFQTPFMVAFGLAMGLLVEVFNRQDEVLQRRQTLNRAGTALVAAAGRDDILAAAVAGLDSLLDGRVARIASPDQAPSGPGRLRLPLLGHGGLQAVLVLDGSEPLAEGLREPVEALCRLVALRLEGYEDGQTRQRKAELRAQELADLNAFKDELLNSVSHELRSPLTSIRAYSELLLTYQEAAVQREFLEIINSESERLARLVSDALDLTHIQSGSFRWNIAPLDVPALLHDAARIYRPLIAREGLEFDVGAEDALPPISGDRDRLLQVLSNLLHNALKFTIRGSVGLAAYHAGHEVHVAVSDSGVGVPPGERELIFDKFHQAGGAPAGKATGTGLGLAICRRIVEHHGGRIWVASAPRGGSVFTFALPVLHSSPSPGA